MAQTKKSVAVLATGGVAAILASACCLGPLVLVSIGLGGAWMSHLQVLEPFRPLSIAVAVVALFFAYRRVFRPVVDCQPGEACAMPSTRLAYKVMFWIVAGLVLVALTFPYVVPYFY